MIRVCEKCQSPRLLHIRKDSDWGYGGDQTRVNDDEHYESGDAETGPLEQEIEYTICLNCGSMS